MKFLVLKYNPIINFGKRFEHIQKRMHAIPKRKTILTDIIYINFSFLNENFSVKVFVQHKEIKKIRKLSDKRGKTLESYSRKQYIKLDRLYNFH